MSGVDDAARRAGHVLRKAGREEEALPWYQKGGEAGDPEAALWAGQLLWRQDQVEDALQWFRRAAGMGLAESATVMAWAMLRSRGGLYVTESWMGTSGPKMENEPIDWSSFTRGRQRSRLPDEGDALLAQGCTEAALNSIRVAGQKMPSIFRIGAVTMKRHGLADEAVRLYELGFETEE